jgi:hypothetical protein
LATWKLSSSPRKKKLQQDRSKGKMMLELFFDSSGIVHMEFIPEGAIVNKHHYKEIFRRPRNSIRCKRPELWCRKNWLLLHDNAPAHHSVLVQEEVAKQNSPFYHTLHTHLISYHAVSFSFTTSKKSHVGVDFSRLRRLSLLHGKPYGTFLQISFSSVFSSYTNIGRPA